MSVVASITGTPERRVALALLLFLCTLYLPFAGNYGMWDPWETHYSEVARQMVARGDFVSLWWPGSPQDRNEFWSKPVLTFWLIALGFKVAGLGGHHPAIPSSPGFAQLDGEMAGLTPGSPAYENVFNHLTYYKLIYDSLEGGATVPAAVQTNLALVDMNTTASNPASPSVHDQTLYDQLLADAVTLLTN